VFKVITRGRDYVFNAATGELRVSKVTMCILDKFLYMYVCKHNNIVLLWDTHISIVFLLAVNVIDH